METTTNKLTEFVRYLAKLVVFFVVPGLHLVSVGKRKIGVVFIGIVLTGQFLPYLLPTKIPSLTYQLTIYPALAGFVVFIVALVFLVIDLPKVGKRTVSRTGFLAFVVVIVTTIMPTKLDGGLVLVNKDHMCPQFCYGDVVTFSPLEREESGRVNIQSGDIIAFHQNGIIHINRVIAGPGEIVCVIKPFRVEVRSEFGDDCDENYKQEDNSWFVSGINPEPSRLGTIYHHHPIHLEKIVGSRAVVMANWSGWMNALSYLLGV